MADKTIGSLPQAPVLTDDSSFVCEDNGEAKRVTGKQIKDFAKKGVSDEAEAQIQAIQSAGDEQTQRVAEEGATQTANAKAQADAAAKSAAAAQSAQSGAEAAQSAAAQSAQDAADVAATLGALPDDVNQLKEDLSDNAKSDAVTKRSLDALWKLNQGISYQFETDDTEAYSKTVPTGAKCADVQMIGGKTIVWNQLVSISYNPTNTAQGLTVTNNNDGSVTINGTSTYSGQLKFGGNNYQKLTSGHKILIRGGYSNSDNTVMVGIRCNGYASESFADYATGTPIIKTAGDGWTCAMAILVQPVQYDNVKVYPQIFDLTQMFGAGNEPTIEEFEAMFPADYYEYNNGELVSASVEAVVERGRNLVDFDVKGKVVGTNGNHFFAKKYVKSGFVVGDKYRCAVRFSDGTLCNDAGLVYLVGDSQIWNIGVHTWYDVTAKFESKQHLTSSVHIYIPNTFKGKTLESIQLEKVETNTYTDYVPYHENTFPIPESVHALPGYGWSAGDVCNSIERTDTGWQYVQRVGSRTYQDGDAVTDGTTTYYELETPVITDITDLMDGILDAITVEGGGTLTFENAAKLDVPNTIEYAVKLSEVGA